MAEAEAAAATTEKMELDESAEGNKMDETNGTEAAADKEAEEKKNAIDKKYATVAQVAAANPHYRVKISGLPRFYTPQDPLLIDFKRLLHKELGLEFKYIRSPKKGNSWLYITFYDQSNQEKALKLLKQYKWKGRTLICTLVVADVLKRKQDDPGDGTSKRARLDIPIEEQMLMSTIPYHTVSYEEQLSKKNEEAQCLFKWLAICMEKKTPKLIGYIDQEIEKNTKTKLPFALDEVRPSPVIDGYRNKCEFRIGQDPTTKKIVVGYRVDNQEDDIIAVAPPDTLRHLPKQMIDVVKVFEEFVQVSPHKPQVMNHDTGVWRLLHVRINRAQQLMVVVLINPTVLDNSAMATLKMELIEYFSTGPASKHGVISLYLHTDNDIKAMGLDKNKRPQGHLELLWGQQHMVEQLLDLHLDIDPNFYFQNNTWGAEVLYKAVTELAAADDNTTVLDLCCGSGGMGLMFAKHCKEVIGVEVQDVNVEDAKKLAAKNGLTNCEFLQGSVDDLFPELEEKLKGKNVIPILDPPRSGISKKILNGLRKLEGVKSLIYVCSNHRPPVKDFLELANANVADPFVATKIIPVDITPHSQRCELVIKCERIPIKDLPENKRVNTSKKRSNKASSTSNSKKQTALPKPKKSLSSRNSQYRQGVVRNRQEIDYLKRDSLYPAVLREALYLGREEEYYKQQMQLAKVQRAEKTRLGQYDSYRRNDKLADGYPQSRYDVGYAAPESLYDRFENSAEGYSSGYGLNPYVSDDLDSISANRYSRFQRDMASALNEMSFPPSKAPARRSLTNSKLAYANALLEEGMRLASEVLETDYTKPSNKRRYY